MTRVLAAASTPVAPSKWADIIAMNPEHTENYVQRFKVMAQTGGDLVGEARFINSMVRPGSRILDAGAGPGRHSGYLHKLDHEVVGVDLDPGLIAAAEADHPGPTYVVGDLARLDLPEVGIAPGFDVIFSAGNVMTFLHPTTRVEVLERFRAHLNPLGRVVVGFGAGRGYTFTDFVSDAREAGLTIDVALSSWDLRPFEADSQFLVAIMSADPLAERVVLASQAGHVDENDDAKASAATTGGCGCGGGGCGGNGKNQGRCCGGDNREQTSCTCGEH